MIDNLISSEEFEINNKCSIGSGLYQWLTPHQHRPFFYSGILLKTVGFSTLQCLLQFPPLAKDHLFIVVSSICLERKRYNIYIYIYKHTHTHTITQTIHNFTYRITIFSF